MRIRELQRMADHEITPEMRMEVGEKFEDFRVAEFKPSQIYTSGPIAGYAKAVLFSNANGRWQSFAFLRAHEATKHVIAYEGLGKSRLKSKPPTPFSLKDGGVADSSAAVPKRKKAAAAAAAAPVKKRKKPVVADTYDEDEDVDDDGDGADDNADELAYAATTAVAAPVKIKIKFKAPKLEDAAAAAAATSSTAAPPPPADEQAAGGAPAGADDDDDEDDDDAAGWKL